MKEEEEKKIHHENEKNKQKLEKSQALNNEIKDLLQNHSLLNYETLTEQRGSLTRKNPPFFLVRTRKN